MQQRRSHWLAPTLITLFVVSSSAGTATLATAQPSWQQRGRVESPAPEEEGRFAGGIGMSGDGQVVAVGASGEDAGGFNRGVVYVYQRQGDGSLTLAATLQRPTIANGANFGGQVRISGDGLTIVCTETLTNIIYTFRKIGGVWTHVGQVDLGVWGQQAFYNIDHYGQTLAVARSSRYVEVYGTWDPVGPFSLMNTFDLGNTGSAFTGAIALSSDGKVIAVGYPGDDVDVVGPGSNPGVLWVFERGASWVVPPQISKLIPADRGPEDQFATGVAMTRSGDRIFATGIGKLVGPNQRGRIYEFRRGAGWTDRVAADAFLPGPPGDYGDFGWRLSVDDSGRFVSASSGGGTLWVFDEKFTVWRGVKPADPCYLPGFAYYTGGPLSADGSMMIGGDGTSHCGTGGAVAAGGAVWSFSRVPDPNDVDEDRLPDTWEQQFGLTGADGDADDDPDQDGVDNIGEYLAGTHPRGFFKRYLAEGAINAFFDVRLALLNVGNATAHLQLRYLQPGGATVTRVEQLAPGRRRTITKTDLAALTSPDFSTVLESDQPVILDRTMSWDSGGYGSHAETGVVGASNIWYLAEGSTSGDFALFYLLQNPNDSEVGATVRYLLPGGQTPIEKTYQLPPFSRTTIPVDSEGPELASTDVSAVVTTNLPIVVERSMYKSNPTQLFAAGHDSAGVTAPSTSWFLAEGATGPFFDCFILLANPNDAPAVAHVSYLLSDGTTHEKSYDVPANGRFTIWVDDEQIPAGSSIKPLDNVAVSTAITSDIPIVVERTMWWPGPSLSTNFWAEAHNSPGATATGTRWGLAEGEVGGPQNAETYILIANTSTFPGSANVTLYYEDGTFETLPVDFGPKTRVTVHASLHLPNSRGKRFGAVIESVGSTPAQIVVERAMYTSPGGVTWAAGTNALATRLPPQVQ